MILAAADLLELAGEFYWAGMLVFLRIGAMMALIPAFGEQTVPVRVRLALGLAFTIVVLPAVSPSVGPRPDAAAALLIQCLAEVLAGLLFGMMLRFFVFALSIAGMIAAQSTSLSQLFGNGAGGEPSPAASHLLVSAGLALAATLGLHVQIVAYMMASYGFIPAGSFPSAQDVVAAGIGEVGRMMSLAFSLSAPFLIAALLYNIMLGIINRAMPQLMVTFVGAPAITAGGLLLLAVAAPVMLSIWVHALGGFLSAPFGPGP